MRRIKVSRGFSCDCANADAYPLLLSRPCGGCRKKGYPAEQCTEGCEACRRARVRCEEGKPCPRCGELGLECSESPGSAMHAPLASAPSTGARYTAASASSKSATSRAGDRAKLACSNCRRDNKKVRYSHLDATPLIVRCPSYH